MMKRFLFLIACSGLLAGATGCKKYLEIVPKGQKIPQSLEDYTALMESTAAHIFDYTNQNMVANDFYLYGNQANNALAGINYNWMADKDRVAFLNTDNAYNAAYSGIFIYNVLINNVPDATTGTPQQKTELVSQARLARSMYYFYLITSYAKMYDPATSATDPGVLLNTSDNMEAKLKQESVKTIYDFILREAEEALPHLPATARDPFYANKAAGFGFLSRVNLFMKNYQAAEKYADSAMGRSKVLFDYIAFYNANKAVIDRPTTSISLPKMDFDNPENYIFHYGSASTQMQGFYASMLQHKDSAQFDKGDTRFIINYAVRTLGTIKIWGYRRMDFPNCGGIRTPEMYYIKAECLARAGKLPEAMEVLNAVRRTRILPAFYADATAGNLEDAMALIRRDKNCEYKGTGLVYLDLRRFNNDPQFRTTLTKEEGGNQYSISPDSHLWIMPFSTTAVAYSDGLIQNSK